MTGEFQHFWMQQMFNLKEDLLKKIMEQVLGREPEMEDAKDFEFISHEQYPGREFIGHKERGLLGEIVMAHRHDSTNFSFHVGFDFIPKNKFDD